MSDNSYNQARAQTESIRDMVAALECDYDRLEELRDEREALQEAVFDALALLDTGTTGLMFLDDGSTPDEGCESLLEAEDALYQWGQENGEELQELEESAGDCGDQEEAIQRIYEDPLSVEVRSGWATPGDVLEAEEFSILLCTGGPAVRILGELDRGEPYRAWIEHQDWFESWQEYHGDGISQEGLLTYCRQFYFGS